MTQNNKIVLKDPTRNLSGKSLILIVDDSREMRTQYRHILANNGYELLEAGSGEEAIKVFSSETKPHLVILDVAMPGMGGIAACKALRQMPEGDKIPILVVTAMDDMKSVTESFKAGANEYINKPVHWEVLRQRIASMLELSSAKVRLISERKDNEAILKEKNEALIKLVKDLNQKGEALTKANERLKEFDNLKSMFIASMSHELRTPLNSVIGFSSIMLSEWTGTLNNEQKQNLSCILKSGRHLLSLINDIIDVSKIEAGKVEISSEDFELYDVINEGIETIRKEAETKKIEIKIDSIHLVMHTDRRKLLQCILNLMSNAVKFTQKGLIHVTAKKIDTEVYKNFVEIVVKDTGIGIKNADLDKLFKSFVRLESSFKDAVPGTGLGLYLSNKIAVEILKGEIVAESKYGEGSRFIMRIPVTI